MRRIDMPVDDPYDFQRPGKKELLRRICGQAGPGSVIQLHAGSEETVAALPDIIAKLRQRGLSLAVLPPRGG